MISFLTGLPRSGKSYRAVWYIQKHFIDPKSKDYAKHRYLYTNIGGFKFDRVNALLSESPLEDYTKESLYLDWDVFYKYLLKLHEMAKADKPDEELLTYARYHKLTPALFVIDEAYRFYTKKSDPVLVWWHGYHGHLGHDILIIIHRPSLMNSDYKSHTEEFIDAQPKSKSINNSIFRYFHYSDDKYTKEARYASDKLTANPDIFALYKSGDLHKPKKIIYKFIVYMIAALFFILFIGKQFYDRSEEKLNPSQKIDNPSSPVAAFDSSVVASGHIFIRVRCDDYSCARIDPSVQLHYLPRLYFDESLKGFNNKLIASSSVDLLGVIYTDYLYSIPKDYLTALGVWSIPIVSFSTPPPSPVNSVVGGNQ